jgi:hypothetical protein
MHNNVEVMYHLEFQRYTKKYKANFIRNRVTVNER